MLLFYTNWVMYSSLTFSFVSYVTDVFPCHTDLSYFFLKDYLVILDRLTTVLLVASDLSLCDQCCTEYPVII